MAFFIFLLSAAIMTLPFLLLLNGWTMQRQLRRIEKTLNQLERASLAGKLTEPKDDKVSTSGEGQPAIVTKSGSAVPPPLPTATTSRAVTDAPKPRKNGGMPRPEVEDHLGAIFGWLKEDWILKLGALLLFAGLGWFVAYAAWNDWISPQVRILGATLLGAGFAAHGWRSLANGRKGGATFLVLGTAIILAATFGGRVRHGLGTPLSALLTMFAASAVPALASIRYGIPSLGRVALGAAMIAPILTTPPVPNWVGIFSYLGACVGGVVWVGRINGDKLLLWLAFAGTLLYSVVLWAECPGYGELLGAAFSESALMANHTLADGVVPLAYILCAIFLVGFLFSSHYETKRTSPLASNRGYAEMVTFWAVAGFYAAWTGWGMPDGRVVLALAAGAAVVFTTGLITLRSGGYRAILAQWSSGVALSMLALNKIMDFPELTLALAGLSLASVAGVFLVTRHDRATLFASSSILPCMAGGYYSLTSPAWAGSQWGSDAFSALASALAAIIIAIFLGRLSRKNADNDYYLTRVSHLLALAGAVLLLALAWLLGQSLFPTGAGTAICLVLYSMVGVGAYWAGARTKHPCLRKYGTILVLLVAGRLLFVEVWMMDTPCRIAAFTTIGAILLIVSKFSKKWDRTLDKERPQCDQGQEP